MWWIVDRRDGLVETCSVSRVETGIVVREGGEDGSTAAVLELGRSGAVTVLWDGLDLEDETVAGCSLWSIAVASFLFLEG